MLFTAILTFPVSVASAADFPNKPIRWVLGFGAGGASDILARSVARGLEKDLGVQVVVENRPGASGIIAAGVVHEAPKDGYTILLLSNSYFNNVALTDKFDFDPLNFEPVTEVAATPNIVVVPASSEIMSIQDLIDAAKAAPGKLSYASGGVGTGTHFGTELFKTMTDTDILHIPYKGTQPALLDLAAGRIDVMFAGASPALPLITAKRLRPIAVTSSRPAAVMPDLPPVAETVPGYEAVTWYAAFAPKGTPKEVVDRLNGAFKAALSDEQVVADLEKQAFDAEPTTPEGLAELLATFIQQTKETAQKARITLEATPQ
ncbi:Bug family tripartite tricarboxylate transporter substrate binding protein [Aquamicrobium terrae]|uniref:Tripartite-type tricarboxylate transporter receptor subunit TctC n=1 Tax=Aquamicrobium terrae TaxID=1324945 RepID=A0ABV2N7D1_9HYPH